jgi:hypothetical protein
VENIPQDRKEPIDGGHLSEEQYLSCRQMHRKLAGRGRLLPIFSNEDGGGLTGDDETIIDEELQRARIPCNDALQLHKPICFPSPLGLGY